MRRTYVLWALALFITLASAIYQRMTGPSYPARGKTTLAGTEIKYRLPRTQGDGPAVVSVAAPAAAEGTVSWKRYKTKDDWTYIKMTRRGEALEAALPHQPPAGKLMYRVILQQGNERVSVHGEPIVIRFKGEVPLPVLIVHVFCMFVGMLHSTRAGLELWNSPRDFRKLTNATLLLLGVGGMLLGPIVQKYAFDAYWTGWPFGTDLTDNKTAAAVVAWGLAWWRLRAKPDAGKWVLAAAIITLIVFGIPHSMFGSELKYE